MAAVRIENDAWSDPRYALLAELAELEAADFALILCARVWSYCTDRNEDVIPESLLDALVKRKGFARKMIESHLAEETRRGIRIKGARGRIEWLASKRNNAAKGGKAKASKRLASASDSLEQTASKPLPSVGSLPSKPLPSAPAPAPAPAPALTLIKSEREETDTSAAPPLSAAMRRDGDVRAVFEHWLKVMRKSPLSTKLNPKRKSKVLARFRDGYTVEQVKQAIDGCAKSPFHMGENDKAEPYNDLETICRDGGALEKHIERVRGSTARSTSSSTPAQDELAAAVKAAEDFSRANPDVKREEPAMRPYLERIRRAHESIAAERERGAMLQ